MGQPVESRVFPRPTPAHLDSLAETLAPLLPGSFHLTGRPDGVAVTRGTWGGVDPAPIQAAVDAAPADSPSLRARAEAERLPDVLKATVLTLLDLVNVERAQHGRPAVTPAQFVAQVKARL